MDKYFEYAWYLAVVMVVLVVHFLFVFEIIHVIYVGTSAMWLHIHFRVCPQKSMYTCVHSFGALRFLQ